MRNWREIFEERLKHDANMRYRIERFRDLRSQAIEIGQKFHFAITPTGTLKLSFVQPKKVKFFGLVTINEVSYPIEDCNFYADSSCADFALP